LRHYLEERAGADVVALGEAAGYQGMRWSGIAFTSEFDLVNRWGSPYRRTSTRDRLWKEPSGTMVHNLLKELEAERRVILWNTVPAHPYQAGRPLSNRRPTPAEMELGAGFALRLIELLQPRLVIAVGRIAEEALGGRATTYVRHPANAGGPAFAQGMRAALTR
jgi:uracil-DNA glycosylase